MPHLIDVHHHILPPEYVKVVGDDRIGPLSVSGKTPEWTPRHSIEAMDRNGIEKAVTSISAPGLWCEDAGAVRRLARHCNDYAAGMRHDHAGRFGVFACLPLPDAEASIDEIAYCFDKLGVDGFGLMTNYNGLYPGDPAFAPIFDELNRRKAVVYFHPTTAQDCGCFSMVPAATLDFPFDTTRAIVSLLFSGTFARCRDIRFVFSHAGGTVPFLAERIARLERRPDFSAKVPDGVIAELRRLHYDTALSANAFSFSALLKLVGPENVLFGSDYPFAPEATMTATVEGLKRLGLDDSARGAIERENALRLLPGMRANGRAQA